MNDYISRSDIQYGYYPIEPVLKGDEPVYQVIAFKHEIDLIPSADVAPVRHAHWIKDEYWSEGTGMGEVYGYYYKCSDCGETVQGDYKECTDKYCRNCGAKMDEKLPKGGSF